jgi:hypothetical protein
MSERQWKPFAAGLERLIKSKLSSAVLRISENRCDKDTFE